MIGDNLTKGNDFYKLIPNSVINRFNVNLINKLIDIGFDVESFIPYGKAHNGIEFVPQILLKGIDQNVISKWITSSYAIDQSIDINFTWPMESASPIHMSIWDENRNLFFDPDDRLELSEKAYSFMAGILSNFDEIFAIIIATSGVIPTVNYKKTFSIAHDDSILCTPPYFIEKNKKDRVGWSKRCIFRGNHPDANMYLVLSSVYLSGINGIINNLNINDYNDNNYTIDSSSLEDKMFKLLKNKAICDLLGNEILAFIISRINGLISEV